MYLAKNQTPDWAESLNLDAQQPDRSQAQELMSLTLAGVQGREQVVVDAGVSSQAA